MCLGAALFAAAPACIIVDDDDDDYYYYDPPPDSPYVEAVAIDEGGLLDAEPGEGVGVFVENQEPGVWHVSTTCDSNYTGQGCDFDLFLDALDLTAPRSDALEADDELEERGDTLRASFYTSYDTDGVFVETRPGEPLRLEVWLDGALDARFVYWIADGEIWQGAPTNPVDFVP